MTEEIFKILFSSYAAPLFEKLIKYRLLSQMLPRIDMLLKSASREGRNNFYASLNNLDREVREKKEDRKGRGIYHLVSSFIALEPDGLGSAELFKDTFKEIKQLIEPITPPNHEVEMAVIKLFREHGLRTPKNVGTRNKPALGDTQGTKEKENRRQRNRRKKKVKTDNTVSEK